MDNWAFNESRVTGSSSTGQLNPLGAPGENQDLLFVEYATSLRGFDYATLFGNKVLLANAELRLPLIRALSSSQISSNFFRNLHIFHKAINNNCQIWFVLTFCKCFFCDYFVNFLFMPIYRR